MTPPDEQTSDLTTVLEEVDKVESVITTARNLLADGKLVDMTALEGKVSNLCEMIVSADLIDSEDVGSSLRAVLKKLEQLGDELVDQHEATASESDT